MYSNYKKWLIVAGAFMLFGCDDIEVSNEVANNGYVNEMDDNAFDGEINENLDGVSEHSEFEFSLVELTKEDFESLKNKSAIYYRRLRGLEPGDGSNLLLSFNQPVQDVSLISITQMSSDQTFAKIGVTHEIGDLNPEFPFVLLDFVEMERLPTNGVSFIDVNGKEHWVGFNRSQEDGSIELFPFDWSSDYLWYRPGSDVDTHLVLEGETLFSIANLHRTTVEVIQSLNDLGTSTEIQVDTFLNISKRFYEDNSDFSVVFTATNGALFRMKGGAGGIVLLDLPAVDRTSLTPERINELRDRVWFFRGEDNDIHQPNGRFKDGVMAFAAMIYYYSHKWDIPSPNPTHGQSMYNLEHVFYFLDRAEEVYLGKI